MPAKSLEYVRTIFHPDRRRDGDEEAPPLPSESNLVSNEANVKQSNSKVDDREGGNAPRKTDRGRSAANKSVPGPAAIPVTRFRSLPCPGPSDSEKLGAAAIRDISTLSLTLTSTSTDLDYSAAAGPKKHQIWLQKAKNFIQQKGEFADDVDMEPSYRWMPIFSGVCVPFSILLEIPGLTGHWFIQTEMGHTVFIEETPRLLEVGLGISMASAVVANLALIRRYMEYKPKAMTLLAIVSLSIHDIINILAIIIFAVKKDQGRGFIFGQSFWMIIGSTLISMFTNITLLYDYIATEEFHRRGSGLTRKQRSLVIIVIILLCWIAVGAAAYSKLMDLSFINALYFTVVSIETVGFGDLAPKSTSARVFAVFYNTVGILNLGMAISTCRETIIESFEHSYRKRLENLIHSRLVRKERRIRKEAIKQALIDAGHNPYIYEQLEEVDQQENPEEPHTFFYQLTHGMKAAAAHARNGHKAILNVNALSPVQMEWVNQTVEERILHERELHQEYHAYPHMLQDESTVEEMREDLNTYGGTLKLLETLGLAGSTSAMEAEQRREFLVKLSTAWALFLLFWLIGGTIFSKTEGWPYGTSVFFCFVTFSTIGYGDLAPSTPAGRSIFVIWALLGVGTMTILISVLTEAYSSKYQSILKTNNFHRSVQAFRKKYGRPDIIFKPISSVDEKIQRNVPTAIPLFPSLPKNGNATSTTGTASEKPSRPVVVPEFLPRGMDSLKELFGQETVEATIVASSSKDSNKVDAPKNDDPVSLPPSADHLPAELLGYMHEFQTHMLYFFNSNTAHPPESLTILLEDILKVGESKGKRISDRRARKEVLHDEDGRKLLFMMSFEDTMRKMMAAVEQYHPFTDVPVAATTPPAVPPTLQKSLAETSPGASTSQA